MSKSMKAALLSAFVFPGLGHLYLQQRTRGIVLAGAALAALVLVISSAVDTAMQISDQILSGAIQPDVATITESLAAQPAGTDTLLMNGAYTVLLIAWVVGIVDAYRTGRRPAGTRDGGEGK